MLWVGLFLAAVGGAMLYFSAKAADQVLHMKATDTSQVAELRSLMDEVRKDLGGGPSELREFVELKGTIGCDRPLQAEMSGQQAVIVRNTVTREIEELHEEQDEEGNLTQRWVSRTETVNSSKLDTPFWIDDGTGRMDVRPTGADFTLQKVVDRFEAPSAVERGSSISFGQLSFNVGALAASHSRRIKGYRFREEILSLGARVYALGEVSDTSDGVALHKPLDGKKPFMLSTKSEEEMVSAGASKAKWLKLGGLGSIGLGVVLVIVGAVQMVAA